MRAGDYWNVVTVDRSGGLLDRFVALLRDNDVRFCVIGGQAVNAYAEPIVNLDLDVVMAIDDVDNVNRLLPGDYSVERFEQSVNVTAAGSDQPRSRT
ncbi:MAG: hypothetical protein FJW23_05205 [Acidimicrobiia bacterium]|nr:hypothetical protein [Acidimicrobiia bacterium]